MSLEDFFRPQTNGSERSNRILLGDGANGTCLEDLGYSKQPYDWACLEAPDCVRQVHRQYFEAGSDFVETNTFQANRGRLGPGAPVKEINQAAARLAIQASAGMKDRYVFGAIGPYGKPMEPIGHVTCEEVFAAVAEQALALAEGGVHGFLLETYTNIEELAVAVSAVRSTSQLPLLVSKAYIEDGEVLAEGLPSRCATQMVEMAVDAVGANCIVGPQRMLDVVRQLSETTDLPILAFPTPGLPQLVKGHIVYDSSPDYFAQAVLRLVEAGATIVGGCCGTTPEHIRQLRSLLDAERPIHRPRIGALRESTAQAPLPASEPTELAAKLASSKFITAVEMDVPRGLNIDKLLAGARALKIAGADVINISDGARARLRMNPSAVANLVQTRVGIEVTMHFSCRDRNILAIQADLLGCHATGIRNILAVTGDPANVGDYPSATSVFDIDAIGLVRILNRFNEGIDLAGNSVGVRCAFTIGVAYNPLAYDPAEEADRLKRKVDAGANVIYTQPIFESALAESVAKTCEVLGVPCFIGVLPLRTARHCEFMHNEVPGIRVPDWLRKEMAEAPSDLHATELGIREAANLAKTVRGCAKGLYLMPPFGSPTIAARVMEASS